eukprot:30135-Pelagococcus_subviridis.AAC.17
MFARTITNARTRVKIARRFDIRIAPMTFSAAQNFTSGMSANGSWKNRITDDTTMSVSACSSPAMMHTSSDGMIAALRVRNARSTGFIFSSRKPSMTNCPAYVPVMVLLCPDASSATANKIFAELPSACLSMSGAFCSGRSMISCRRSSEMLGSSIVCAATMTTAKLITSVTASAHADSSTLYFNAVRSGFSPIRNRRESTSAECRNKLCGITTAPRSEMAMNSAFPSRIRGTTTPSITSSPSPPPRRPISATKQTAMTPTSEPCASGDRFD